MLRWLLRGFRRPAPRTRYDTTVGRWIEYGARYVDENGITRVKRYPSLAAKLNDPGLVRDGMIDVIRDMHGDQPASPWRRSWSEDRKALRNED